MDTTVLTKLKVAVPRDGVLTSDLFLDFENKLATIVGCAHSVH